MSHVHFSTASPDDRTLRMTAPSASATPLAAGDIAPDVTLAGTSGGAITLSDFRKKCAVLVAFFPLAFTGTCTAELCAFSEDCEQFTGKGVEIVPVSVDAVPSLAEFKKKYNMTVDLYSDFKREASRAFGVLREDTYFSNRAYFLLDKAGVIQWAYVEDTPGTRRDNTEILAAIEALEG